MFQVTIAGYAGNDIDQKQVPLKNKSGSVEIGTVSIGINTGKDQTTWVKAKFLGTQTNNRARHIKKGAFVSLTGKAEMETWNDKTTNEPRSILVVTVDSFSFTRAHHNAETETSVPA